MHTIMDEKTTKLEFLGRINKRRDRRQGKEYESFYVHLVKESTEPYREILEKLTGKIVKISIELEDGQY